MIDFKNVIPILSIFLSCSLIQGQSVVTKENYDQRFIPKEIKTAGSASFEIGIKKYCNFSGKGIFV